MHCIKGDELAFQFFSAFSCSWGILLNRDLDAVCRIADTIAPVIKAFLGRAKATEVLAASPRSSSPSISSPRQADRQQGFHHSKPAKEGYLLVEKGRNSEWIGFCVVVLELVLFFSPPFEHGTG